MARTAYSLNSYTGGAGAAYLTGSGIGATDTTITITGTNSGWSPLGSTGGWYLDLDFGTANEEKVFVASGTYYWSSGVVTISGITRGIDETNAVVHSGGGMPTGVVCTPVLTAIDATEANTAVYTVMDNAPAGYYLTANSGILPPTYSSPTAYTTPPIFYVASKNFLAWTEDSQLATATQTLVTGTCYYNGIWVPTQCTISGISLYISTFASTDTMYLSLFSAATNKQVAVCSGLKGGSTGFITVSVSGGTYALPGPGGYYVAIVISGSTSFVAYGSVAGQANLINMGITSAMNTFGGFRQASVVIGQRALYSNGTTVSGALTGSVISPFFALS